MAGSLDGIRVLDLSRFIAGPYCGMLLADMGAEVVKVETSRKGDPARVHPPLIGSESVYYQVMNRNKLGLYLDLRSGDGKDVFWKLVEKADVLIENYRPGTMDEMGFPWEKLSAVNPRLILARISGAGQTGPEARQPYFDVIAQAISGLMSLTGSKDGPPMRSGVYLSDYVSGIYTALGITAALTARHATGRGQIVDTSLLDTDLSLLLTAIPEYRMQNREATRGGNRDRYSAPTSAYRTRDDVWIFIAAGNDTSFPRLCRAMGRPEIVSDPRFDSMKTRLANFDELEPIVAAWMATMTESEALAALAEVEVPCSRINTIGDMLKNRQVNEPGRLLEIDHPTLGKIPMHGFAVSFSDTPSQVRRHAPELGEHTEDVLKRWLQ